MIRKGAFKLIGVRAIAQLSDKMIFYILFASTPIR